MRVMNISARIHLRPLTEFKSFNNTPEMPNAKERDLEMGMVMSKELGKMKAVEMAATLAG